MSLIIRCLARVVARLCVPISLTFLPFHVSAQEGQSVRPNIVLIVTDDQGIGDIGANGNPAIQTPNLDALSRASLRFTDFHVDPTCSPTRAALMTGQHSLHAGVWHTVIGRNFLPNEKVTMAEVLRANGYRTGHFGKWHLGDNYPFRPQDQGFDKVSAFGGGAIGNTADFWGNTQFGDIYLVDGKPTAFAGYATDIWFDQALDFIREGHSNKQPFFAYIATNAPHSPYRAPIETVEYYLDKGLPNETARFFAMITELDRNIGELLSALRDIGIEDNTILIFMTDNGTSAGAYRIVENADVESFDIIRSLNPDFANWVFNGGLRGKKGSVYDGGHRVPLFVHWPDGGLGEARDVPALSSHFDLLPTLIDLLNLDPVGAEMDGISLVPAIEGNPFPQRTIVVTNQRVNQPLKERPAVVMTPRWRYIPADKTLFDIEADPAQNQDVSNEYPTIVSALQTGYDRWWERMVSLLPPRQKIIVGNEREPLSRITSHDFIPNDENEEIAFMTRAGADEYAGHRNDGFEGREGEFEPRPFLIHVDRSATYRIRTYLHDRQAAKSIPAKKAYLEVGSHVLKSDLKPDATHGVFNIPLVKGDYEITAWFESSLEQHSLDRLPSFYIYIEAAD